MSASKPKRRKPVVHKTCPTWGMTQCRKVFWWTTNLKASCRWRDVTCSKCLKDGGRL